VIVSESIQSLQQLVEGMIVRTFAAGMGEEMRLDFIVPGMMCVSSQVCEAMHVCLVCL